MGDFALVVAGWHDFYMMVGTAAATLVGLLFVGLSLNADLMVGETQAASRVLAAQAFANFLFILMFAVLFLIPDQGPLGLGLPLLGIAAFGLYRTLQRFTLARRTSNGAWRKARVGRRVGVSAVCYFALLAVAVSVLLGGSSGLYWLVPVMILLTVEASVNAWDLLLNPRQQRTSE